VGPRLAQRSTGPDGEVSEQRADASVDVVADGSDFVDLLARRGTVSKPGGACDRHQKVGVRVRPDAWT
jgi:hypothetical protein